MSNVHEDVHADTHLPTEQTHTSDWWHIITTHTQLHTECTRRLQGGDDVMERRCLEIGVCVCVCVSVRMGFGHDGNGWWWWGVMGVLSGWVGGRVPVMMEASLAKPNDRKRFVLGFFFARLCVFVSN